MRMKTWLQKVSRTVRVQNMKGIAIEIPSSWKWKKAKEKEREINKKKKNVGSIWTATDSVKSWWESICLHAERPLVASIHFTYDKTHPLRCEYVVCIYCLMNISAVIMNAVASVGKKAKNRTGIVSLFRLFLERWLFSIVRNVVEHTHTHTHKKTEVMHRDEYGVTGLSK